MSLENNLEEEGKFDVGVGVVGGGLGGFTGYFVAGGLTQLVDFSDNFETGVTAGILTGSVILGYHALIKGKDFVGGKVKKVVKRIKKDIKRNKVLYEMSLDKEFLERQGIKGDFDPVKENVLKQTLGISGGSLLGYFSGIVGIAPLCVYFGETAFGEDAFRNREGLTPGLDSGGIAGIMIGAYAFSKMIGKKQYERVVTTASALTGIAGTHIAQAKNITPNWVLESNIPSDPEFWAHMGYCALGGVVAGAVGNLVYKGVKKVKDADEVLRGDRINK